MGEGGARELAFKKIKMQGTEDSSMLEGLAYHAQGPGYTHITKRKRVAVTGRGEGPTVREESALLPVYLLIHHLQRHSLFLDKPYFSSTRS